MSRLVRYGFLLASTLGLVSACQTPDTSTQITVAITSETNIPKELDSLEVTVLNAKGVLASYNLYGVQDPRFFPATLAVIPKTADSLEGPVTVVLRGFLTGKDAQVFRRATLSYVEGRTLLLPMPLRMACFNFRECAEGETCSGGTCQPAQVDSSKLATYDEHLVFGKASPETCFDEDECIGESTKASVRGSDCSFPLPDGAIREGETRPRVNVSIRWKAAENRVIVLDHGDPVEGWTIESGRGRLSPGVCASLLDLEPDPKRRQIFDQALDVWVSTQCAAKVNLQPFCTGKDGHVGIGASLRNPR
jgi:hypothetical protein